MTRSQVVTLLGPCSNHDWRVTRQEIPSGEIRSSSRALSLVEVDLEVVDLTAPPSPSPSARSRPGSCLSGDWRPSSRTKPLRSPEPLSPKSASTRGQGVDLALSTERPPVPPKSVVHRATSSTPAVPQLRLSQAGPTSPGHRSADPASPGWSPSSSHPLGRCGGVDGWQPQTPSTVCEESDGLAPMGKFIHGEYVPRRPTSAGVQLPPLISAPPIRTRKVRMPPGRR